MRNLKARSRNLVGLWALIALLSGSNALFHGTAPASARTAESKYPKTVAMLDAFAQRELTDKGLPGLAIALVDGQEIVWQKGFGYSDPEAKKPVTNDTIFRVGSVSKLFTDIAVMKLVEEGKLDLDAPVSTYLPDFKPRNPFEKAITLRHLMSHRSGLVREPPVGHYFDDSGTSLKDTVASLNRTELVYEPETRLKYSNAGIAVVGYVLEKTQNEPFAKYLESALLGPLGMKNTSFEPAPEIARHLAKARMTTVFGKSFDAPTFELGMAPAGSMYTTTGDLTRFASAIFAANDDSFLKKETLDKMWQPQFAEEGQTTGGGIGFFISELEGHRRVGHGGAIYGFSTEFAILPDEELGVVVVSTEDVSNGVTDRIADLALSSMLNEKENKPVPQPEFTGPFDPQFAKSIAGRYSDEESAVDLFERGGKLWMIQGNGGIELRLRSLGEDLIVDDKLGFGMRIKTDRASDSITIGKRTFKRVPVGKPSAAPEVFKGLIGEYGPDWNTSYVFERDGKLWLLIEQIEFDQLKQVSADVFDFPNGGLYHGEQVVFKRDGKGRATEMIAAGVSFKRRNIGPDEGAEQLLVKVVRPVKDLVKEALVATPPEEKGDFLGTDLVELAKLDPTIKLDVRYATTNNLFGSVFYSQPRAFMQRPAAEAVARISQRLKKQGYGLLVHDAYRPWYVTKVFWDATPQDLKIFVADPSQGSRHNRGAAVDLTLYDLKTGKPVKMVGTYDETTDRSYPYYPGGTSLERWHRDLLMDAMEADGFTVYEAEWWHFDYNDWRRYRIGNERFEEIGR